MAARDQRESGAPVSARAEGRGVPNAGRRGESLDRRRIFGSLGAAAAAAGVVVLGAGLPDRALAATGGNFILGKVNDAADTTKLMQTSPGGAPDPVFEVEGDHSLAIYAHSAGIGVSGTGSIGVNAASNSATLPGLLAMNNGGGPGMLGAVNSASAATEGDNEGSGPGVLGKNSGSGAGVKGTTGATAAGVWGSNSGSGPGVLGDSSGNGAGIKAMNSGTGVALEVDGRARFSGAAGAGSIPVKASSATVSNALVTATSHISASLTGDPGSNAVVQWVERNPGAGFTLHLSDKVNNPTPFTYLIVEP